MFTSLFGPEVGQLLQVQAEVANLEDPHIVAIIQHDDETVGHIPGISFYFQKHSGCINCEITGKSRLPDVQDKDFLVVPCTYSFIGSPKLIKRLVKEMCKKKNETKTGFH